MVYMSRMLVDILLMFVPGVLVGFEAALMGGLWPGVFWFATCNLLGTMLAKSRDRQS